MFLKFITWLQRIIYFRRYRSAENIRKAAALLGTDQAVEALFLLRDTRKGLHESLLPIYALTLGQVFIAMDRPADAKNAFEAATRGSDDVASRAREYLARLDRVAEPGPPATDK